MTTPDDELHEHQSKTGISRAWNFSNFKSRKKWSKAFSVDFLPGEVKTFEFRAGYPLQ